MIPSLPAPASSSIAWHDLPSAATALALPLADVVQLVDSGELAAWWRGGVAYVFSGAVEMYGRRR